MALQLQHEPHPDLPLAPAEARRRAARGLLIVNADDWGGMRSGTDAIERCFEAGTISSTTAMMFMKDTARARDIALLGGRPVGLHVNLTQAYEAGPAGARERQLRLLPHFSHLARRRWLVCPRRSVRTLIADVVRDQLDEFRALYGTDPTHLDSHNHAHVCPDVLLALPRNLPVRQTMSPDPGHRSLPRALKHRCIARRFDSTERLWSFPLLNPALGGEGLGAALDSASSEPVEIVCHPSFPQELQVLLSEGWRRALQGRPLGDFRNLPGS